MSNFALYSKVLFRPGLLFWLSWASQPVKLGKLLIQTPGGCNRTKTPNKDQRKRKKCYQRFLSWKNKIREAWLATFWNSFGSLKGGHSCPLALKGNQPSPWWWEVKPACTRYLELAGFQHPEPLNTRSPAGGSSPWVPAWKFTWLTGRWSLPFVHCSGSLFPKTDPELRIDWPRGTRGGVISRTAGSI